MRGEDFPPCFLYYLLAIASFLYIQICNPAQKLPEKEVFPPPAQIADHIFSS